MFFFKDKCGSTSFAIRAPTLGHFSMRGFAENLMAILSASTPSRYAVMDQYWQNSGLVIQVPLTLIARTISRNFSSGMARNCAQVAAAMKFHKAVLVSQEIIDKEARVVGHDEILGLPFVIQQLRAIDAHKLDGHASRIRQARAQHLRIAVGKADPGFEFLPGVAKTPWRNSRGMLEST